MSIEGRLFCYGRERLDDLDGMIGNDYAVTGSAGKKGRAGKVGFVVFGIIVVAGGLSGGGYAVHLLLAAPIVGAARHARQEQDVQREKK